MVEQKISKSEEEYKVVYPQESNFWVHSDRMHYQDFEFSSTKFTEYWKNRIQRIELKNGQTLREIFVQLLKKTTN